MLKVKIDQLHDSLNKSKGNKQQVFQLKYVYIKLYTMYAYFMIFLADPMSQYIVNLSYFHAWQSKSAIELSCKWASDKAVVNPSMNFCGSHASSFSFLPRAIDS